MEIFSPVREREMILSWMVLLVNWGNSGHWGLDPARPEGDTGGSFVTKMNLRIDMQHSDKEHKQEGFKVRSILLRDNSGRDKRKTALCPGVWVSTLNHHLLIRDRIFIT